MHKFARMAPPPPMLPSVHSYLIKQEPMFQHQQAQATLPSLPSLLGSLNGDRQYAQQQQYTPQQQQQQQQYQYQLQQQQQYQQQQQQPQQSAPLPLHPTQLQPPVSILSLLNPSMDARAATPFRSLPSLAAAAPLARVRPRPAAYVPATASPISTNGSESGLDDSSSQQQTQTQGAQPKKKRKARICKTDGCEKYVVDRGLCIRHGVSASVSTYLAAAIHILTRACVILMCYL